MGTTARESGDPSSRSEWRRFLRCEAELAIAGRDAAVAEAMRLLAEARDLVWQARSIEDTDASIKRPPGWFGQGSGWPFVDSCT